MWRSQELLNCNTKYYNISAIICTHYCEKYKMLVPALVNIKLARETFSVLTAIHSIIVHSIRRKSF